jgi:hypothetical protein
MLARLAGAEAAPEPVEAGADSVTRLVAADFVAEPVPDAAGALAVIAVVAADREAPPVADDTGADSATDDTEALAEPFTTVEADADPDGASSDSRSIEALVAASAEVVAARTESPTAATAPVAAASLPACQYPASIASTAPDSGLKV